MYALKGEPLASHGRRLANLTRLAPERFFSSKDFDTAATALYQLGSGGHMTTMTCGWVRGG